MYDTMTSELGQEIVLERRTKGCADKSFDSVQESTPPSLFMIKTSRVFQLRATACEIPTTRSLGKMAPLRFQEVFPIFALPDG
jgi:hypothetical protein